MEPRLRKIPSHVRREVAQLTTWAQNFQATLSDAQLFEEMFEEIFCAADNVGKTCEHMFRPRCQMRNFWNQCAADNVGETPQNI